VINKNAKLRLADWIRAFVAAVGLSAAAAFVIFVIRPGGFERQVGSFLALMPGVVVGSPLAEHAYRISAVSRQSLIGVRSSESLSFGISH
jgi:hypothetical protein